MGRRQDLRRIEGGFLWRIPAVAEGLTAGLLRLRTARLNLDWKNTSIVAGQEAVFFSPQSPTSLLAMAYPALSGSGNLWTWTPQVYVEHRIPQSESTKISIQGGVLDPLTGELPTTEYDRTPTAGERSRVPAYATRLAWQRTPQERLAAIGVGGYYSKQDWGFGHNVNSWALTADWDLSLGRWFSFSGEAYRGRAIGGLGGGATGSVLESGAPSTPGSFVTPVNSLGGWSQLKFKPTGKVQFNAAFGKDGSGSGLDRLPAAFGVVHRNASGFVNVIFQPRSNLILSGEYRRLWTSRYSQPLSVADHIGLGAGILF